MEEFSLYNNLHVTVDEAREALKTHQVILIQNTSGKIIGIVTSADLNDLQFKKKRIPKGQSAGVDEKNWLMSTCITKERQGIVLTVKEFNALSKTGIEIRVHLHAKPTDHDSV